MPNNHMRFKANCGTIFGYHNLMVDYHGISEMQSFAFLSLRI